MMVTSLQSKTDKALRTIGETANILGLPSHVVRFWETKFSNLKPVKYNGRRYYSPENISILKQIKELVHEQGYSIKGAIQCFKQPKLKSPPTKKPADLEKTLERLFKARDKLTSLLK
jgi:DNA-binding transcriptional MerR regulator